MNGRIFLCDFARVTDNGARFDVIGAGINLIHVPQFPVPVNFAVLIETRFSLAEADREHSFELRIIDPDGKHAAPPIIGNVKISKEHRGALYAAFNMQMLMKMPVSLTFSLLMNGEEKDSVTVKIIQTQINMPNVIKQNDSK